MQSIKLDCNPDWKIKQSNSAIPWLVTTAQEKVTNIEYGDVDFENDIIEFLTSTQI